MFKIELCVIIMNTLSLFIALLFVILGLIKTNSKVISFILVVLIYLLFAFEHSEGDYEVYQQLFYNISVGDNFALTYEAFFVLLCKTADSYGLSFEQLRYIVSGVSVLLLFITAKKFTDKTAYVFALFFVFPALVDAELFRQLTGSCIVIFGLHYLINQDSWMDYIKYLICVVIGALFQVSLWFCIVFLLVAIHNKKALKTSVLIIVGVVLVMPSLFFQILSYLPMREYLVDRYMTYSHSNINGILYTIMVLSATYSMSVFGVNKDNTLRIKDRSTNSSIILNANNLQNKIQDINIVAFLLIIPMYYSGNVERLLHVVLFYNYIALANRIDNQKFVGLYGVCVMLLLFIANLFFQEGIRYTVLTHFTEGFLVNFWNVVF